MLTLCAYHRNALKAKNLLTEIDFALQSSPMKTYLRDFVGDLGWLHAREGHRGFPYWPGGKSGVTVDPGLDIGHADWQLVAEVLRPHLSDVHLGRLKDAAGLKGEAARLAVKSPLLREIRISRELAADLLPQVADPYWSTLIRRFPALASAPGPVQTGMLSLAYNRGAWSRDLRVLAAALADGDWLEVGRLVSRMQQDHAIVGIRSRRRLEGELIASAAKANAKET